MPTPASELYDWHRRAIRGEKVRITFEPQCGWFLTRLTYRGQYMPASIYMHQMIDGETGELMSDEEMRAEILGERVADLEEAWLRFARRPTCKLEYMNRLGGLI